MSLSVRTTVAMHNLVAPCTQANDKILVCKTSARLGNFKACNSLTAFKLSDRLCDFETVDSQLVFKTGVAVSSDKQ